MGLFNKVFGDSDARAAHNDAREELHRVAKRDGYESDDFINANSKVAAAEKNLPKWRQIKD